MSRQQSGAALLLCVLLLASLSLLGLSAASDTMLQQRMGANRSADERDLRRANARLRALEAALLSLPGDSRPDGCPDNCLARIPPGTTLEEVHLSPPSTSGQPETSWFLLEVHSADTPLVVRSVLARPWGDAAWSDGGAFCAALESPAACGRTAWEQRGP